MNKKTDKDSKEPPFLQDSPFPPNWHEKYHPLKSYEDPRYPPTPNAFKQYLPDKKRRFYHEMKMLKNMTREERNEALGKKRKVRAHRKGRLNKCFEQVLWGFGTGFFSGGLVGFVALNVLVPSLVPYPAKSESFLRSNPMALSMAVFFGGIMGLGGLMQCSDMVTAKEHDTFKKNIKWIPQQRLGLQLMQEQQ